MIQLALELYFDDKGGLYPASLLELEGKFMPTPPRDPATGALYFYGLSSDRQNYVVGAKLEDRNNSELLKDADGLIHGIDCNDPVYCVTTY